MRTCIYVMTHFEMHFISRLSDLYHQSNQNVSDKVLHQQEEIKVSLPCCCIEITTCILQYVVVLLCLSVTKPIEWLIYWYVAFFEVRNSEADGDFHQYHS